MIGALSKKRSSKEHLIIHMKFAILVLLTFFFWQSPGARRSAAIALQQTAKFVQPEPTNLQERFDRLNSEFSNCLTLE